MPRGFPSPSEGEGRVGGEPEAGDHRVFGP
jgi:hypothetical protein